MTQVELLLLVIFPEAERRPTSPLNESEGSFARSPVFAPSHDGRPGVMAELATIQANMEALELDNKNLRGQVGGTTIAANSNRALLVRCSESR